MHESPAVEALAATRVTRNVRLLCAYQACFSLLFPVAIFSLFWHETLGMSVTTMLTVQAFFGLVLAAFEFPSGYIADRLGHRLAIVLGSAVVMVGWLLYACAHGLLSVVCAEAVLGVGFSLISGADSALLYESLRLAQREGEFARWYAWTRAIAQVAEACGALLAGLMFAYAPRLPFQAQVLAFGLALLLALRLLHTPVLEAERRGHLAQMGFIVRHALRDHPTLPALSLASVSFSLMSFLPIWLIALHARQSGLPEAAIGPFWAVANVLVALGALAGERLGRAFGIPVLLWSCVGLAALGYAVLGLAPGIGSTFGYLALTLARGLHAPALHHEEQRAVPSADRAAFISFRNFLFRGSYVVLGPLIGIAADAHGLRAVLLGLGCGVVPLLVYAVCTLLRAFARNGTPLSDRGAP